jgi:hypothetical protein
MKGYFNKSHEHSLNSRGVKTKNRRPIELIKANDLISSGKVQYMSLHSGVDVGDLYDNIYSLKEKFKVENVYVDVMGVEGMDDNLIILSVIPLTKQTKHSIMILYKKEHYNELLI